MWYVLLLQAFEVQAALFSTSACIFRFSIKRSIPRRSKIMKFPEAFTLSAKINHKNVLDLKPCSIFATGVKSCWRASEKIQVHDPWKESYAKFICLFLSAFRLKSGFKTSGQSTRRFWSSSKEEEPWRRSHPEAQTWAQCHPQWGQTTIRRHL